MSTGVKVTVIGAGSAQFSLGLVKDLCLTQSLAGSLVSFMDINPERLEMIHKLASRYAAELGADLRFERTMDRAAALQDADFVINTAYPTGHHQERRLRELTAKHGYYYGGVSLGDYYELKLMLDVARDIERICPDAWLIQSGNPVCAGSTLMTRETGIKVCGLCHGHYGYQEIARVIGIPHPEQVTWQAPGLNHNIWLTHFIYEGKDAYPLIDEWIATKGEEYWRRHVATRTHDIQMSRGAVHQYRLYGLFPIGDTPRRFNWWYHTDIETKKYWFGEPWGGPDTELARPFFVQELEARVAEMARLANDPKASLVQSLGGEPTREQQVPIIDGLVNDHEGYFQVNVPNRGALAGIPDDVVVEVPAIVNKKGIQPCVRPLPGGLARSSNPERSGGEAEGPTRSAAEGAAGGPLPRKIMLECILPDWLEMERGLEAFKTGDRSMLLWDVLQGHQTRSYDQGLAVFEDMLKMEGNQDLAEHFRGPRV